MSRSSRSGRGPQFSGLSTVHQTDDTTKRGHLFQPAVGGQIQTLYKWEQGLVDQHCNLQWAGDLDGDGKLDLVMDLSDYYNLSELTLFLSSGAGTSIVKKVSSFCTSGC